MSARHFLHRAVPIISLGLALLGGGCSTVPTADAIQPKVSPATHVVMINLSDYEWQVEVAASEGRETYASHLPARAFLEVDLAGGDYLITQTMLTGHGAPESTRRFPAHLEPGQTYRWSLVTLLSAPAEPSGRKHE